MLKYREDLASLDSSVASMKGKLPFLISLSSEEKKSLFKARKIYQPFLQKAVQAVREHPEIMPGMFNTSAFLKDYNLYPALCLKSKIPNYFVWTPGKKY